MILYVAHFDHLGGFRIAVTFNDGSLYEVDLADELYGPVFEPLRDPAAFAQIYLDPETRTVAWPNGADVAPEYLREIGKAVSAA